MPARNKFIIGSVIIVAALAALAYTGFTESKTYYHTISELPGLHGAAAHQRIRVAGNVRTGSINRLPGRVDFVLEEQGRVLDVSYAGRDPLPDTFKDNAQALVEGKLMPDGRFVAYMSDESGRNEIYIRPFTPPDAAGNPAGGQWQISTGGGVQPRWSPDGRELFYIDPAGRMMAVSITLTGATVAPGTPVLLFPTKIFGGGGMPTLQYAVAHDGRFLINTVLDENRSTAPIRLIQNWQPPGQ